MILDRQFETDEGHELTESFESLLAKTSANKHRIFIKRSGDGNSGFERSIQSDIPRINLSPKFQIKKDEPVFTVGSCFARNIEHALIKSGIDVITTRCLIPDELYELTGVGARNGALNAYTPHSMLDLLRWSDRGDRMSAGALDLGDGNWADMLVSGLKFMSREELELVRGKILNTYEELSSARTVIITLGYTEAWFDKVDNTFVNRSPAATRATMKHGNRYQFQNADALAVLDCLDKIVKIIRIKTNDTAKIVFTTSPVPMHGTFTENDVICANMYSKSTLLSAAVATAAKYDFVDYFPSYEMVFYSSPQLAWEDDGIHVKPSLVGEIVSRFTNAYIS